MGDHIAEYVLVEYGSYAGDRRPVVDVGVLPLAISEYEVMQRRLVWTPCRLLPAKWFPEVPRG